MGNSYFFTGFPGFIASQIIHQLIKEQEEVDHIYVLVLPNMYKEAEIEAANLLKDRGLQKDCFTIIEGDITKENLGIADHYSENLFSTITHVFHLAAIYDLAVPKDIAYLVNVTGTEHVNQFVKRLQKLKRYIYFSTAYVAGDRKGKVLESDLEGNHQFQNYYEETKYEAEILVKKIMKDIPTTIIRPGIVKGHSESGETIKFDGPYFILNFLDRLKFLPILPYIGPGEVELNLVPVDYIIAASCYLGHTEVGKGKTYHLTDPSPYKVKDVYSALMNELLQKKPTGRIPIVVTAFLLNIKFVRKFLRVEKEALDYFKYEAKFDCQNAVEDLKGSGISCPDFMEKLEPMVNYYKTHKNDEKKQLVIR
ncbi:SDR family oxidoreductase [Chengkuizengella axinellae]|uniref:SDR family oxidoreductase n=1 Tax=Chengkuizengella axinellae TaxID=3064388 RepID=A0ABT9IT55_9BACL|nr:SDR family oxidoreductase [Chengkuizengella sp. 2205SS18-9]MDP5272531.1 SDR family oxidoreductase [Chengkuizengella sp. 2205SS18-9]